MKTPAPKKAPKKVKKTAAPAIPAPRSAFPPADMSNVVKPVKTTPAKVVEAKKKLTKKPKRPVQSAKKVPK